MATASRMIRRGGRSCITAEDRLSALPDVLLHSILSLLKARQVVQTSVLAKRWKDLWRSVPCINLDQKEFSGGRKLVSRRELEKFEDFGDVLLLLRDPSSSLDTLSLHVREGNLGPIDARRWIRRALNCSLRALHIHGEGFSTVKLPLYLGPSSYCFKSLHLCGIVLDEKFGKAVSSAFVCLEDLKLKDCETCFLKITSTSLRNLIMVGDNFEGSDELIITAPRLVSLLLSNINIGTTSINKMLSLEKASICLECYDLEETDNQIKFPGNLFNVTSLELSGFYEMEESEAESVKFPTFKNLRTLLLNHCDLTNGFQLLLLFLKNSPNLEKLTVSYCQLPEGPDGGKGRADFQCHKLKSTEIFYDRDGIRELAALLLDVSGHAPKLSMKTVKNLPACTWLASRSHVLSL